MAGRNTQNSETRLARELETRDTAERPKAWQPASVLPEPDKQPGYAYRWIRVSALNLDDPRNVSSKLRQGWEPVKIEEQPQFKMFVDRDGRYEDNIEVAGLLLCKMPEEFVQQRNEYYSKRNKDQMESVDNNFLRENDPRMPLFSDRKSQTSFGKGR